MKDEWRTHTVVSLCLAMREARDYSACPILADALQEAGMPEDHSLLAQLRDVDLPTYRREQFVAMIYSEESLQAMLRIENLADRMGVPGYPSYFTEGEERNQPMTYERLMAAATRYADTGDDGLGDGSMDWSNLGGERADGSGWWDPDEPDKLSVEDQFWKDWSLVTGRPIPDGSDGAIFRCSC
jgi:hypothetical protein